MSHAIDVCSTVAVRDISDVSLLASLSSVTLSVTSSSDCGASPFQDGTIGRHYAATIDITDSQTHVDVEADTADRKTSVMSADENCSVDNLSSCSRTDVNPVSLSSLPSIDSEGRKDSEAVNCVLCLVHGLSHCSYDKASLLVLVEHAAYDATVDLFVYVWHRLQTSQQQNDRIQACMSAVSVLSVK